jgi:hypothetical protein
MDAASDQKQMELIKTATIIIFAILILFGALYASYAYSQKQKGDIILPGGVTYLGPTKTK